MRTLAIAVILIVLALGMDGNVEAWTVGETQCSSPPGLAQYKTCSELTGQAAGAPDSVTDIGPLPHYSNGSIDWYYNSGPEAVEQCRVVWNSPVYVWTAWAFADGTPDGANCDVFWNSYLGVWNYWGANQSPHTGIAPVRPPGY